MRLWILRPILAVPVLVLLVLAPRWRGTAWFVRWSFRVVHRRDGWW